jgi:hypothetical protein
MLRSSKNALAVEAERREAAGSAWPNFFLLNFQAGEFST